MLGGADNPNGELPSYITGADTVSFNTSEPKLNVLFSQSSCVNEVGCVRTELSPRDETVFAIL